jgi:peptidoglycan/xylan/chitin deacetylase (PgdA/CDA1 family)
MTRLRIPGLKLVQRTLRRARIRVRGGIVVLGYHRIGNGEDPFGMAVSLEHFRAHLEVLTRHAHPMRLSEAVDAVAARRIPPRAVVVTFDDGYADTCREALPLLERAGVPATIFVTTGYQGREFWWDELARIMMGTATLPHRLDLDVRGQLSSWILRSGEEKGPGDRRLRLNALMSLAADLRTLPALDRERAMQALRVWAGTAVETQSSSRPRALLPDEIRRLAASSHVDIGAHTVSHSELTALPSREQRREVQESREELERITGTVVTSFSYPHGAYAAETRRIVADAGFTISCCSTPDALHVRSDRFAVPRLWVENVDGRDFARWLDGWLAH